MAQDALRGQDSQIGHLTLHVTQHLLALGRRSALPIVRAASIVYIELVRAVPLITVLFMASIMFALFLPEGVSFDKLLRAQVAIVLFNAAYIAEIVRAGLQALPRGQYEAADALGLGYWQTQLLVILPQALKITIPAQVNSFIDNFKDTSLVIIVSIFDFLYAVRQAVISDLDWRHYFVEGYLFAMAVYWLFCYAMSHYSQWLEKHLSRDHRYAVSDGGHGNRRRLCLRRSDHSRQDFLSV